jgi:hypothetical protein
MTATATPPNSGDRRAAPIEAEDPGQVADVRTPRRMGRLFLARFNAHRFGPILVITATTADA